MRSAPEPSLRILILNWRDARHPRAGGAEFYTHELARRLVASGSSVEWFTSAFPGGANEEVIDGIRIVRRGRQWSVHLFAYQRYRRRLRSEFDVVIDEINTVPFFTPLWAGIPTFVMIWQLAREVWWYESRFPLNVIGYVMEPLYLRIYRNVPVFTFSASTVSDLLALGFRAKITKVSPGIEPTSVTGASKTSEPSFIYAGRLAPSKRVHEIVEAFAIFRGVLGAGRLVLAGNGAGSYVRRLERLADTLRVSDHVEFCGWLQGSAKFQRMAEAHALLMASAREGWGLVVTECNSCGTPAIVYDVPGLRDSVRHLQTGLVVRPTPPSLAEGMLRVIQDPELYDRLRKAGQSWSRTLTYDAGTTVVLETMTEVVVR